jgi:superfamily I DNA and/or RNA helicase
MSVQFRMREPIGDLVSRVFYPAGVQPNEAPPDGLPVGGLATYIDPDPAKRIAPVRFASPRVLDGESLVWLDTAGISSCRNQPHWWNPGEAAVVLELVGQLAPFPKPNQDGYGESPLAVLTPYREQLKLLQGSSLVAPYLSTIHAFQGREADVVILSLVRDTAQGGGRGPAAVQAQLGHLGQRQLVNVMFSRARRQLVIVGRFDHYARIMGPDGFWTQVCRAVELRGTRLSAYDLFGDVSAMVAPREPLDVPRAADSGALR